MNRAEAVLLALVLLGPVHADEAREPPTERPHPSGEAAPSLDLLEFLGSWETATGPWNESIPDREPRAPLQGDAT